MSHLSPTNPLIRKGPTIEETRSNTQKRRKTDLSELVKKVEESISNKGFIKTDELQKVLKSKSQVDRKVKTSFAEILQDCVLVPMINEYVD